MLSYFQSSIGRKQIVAVTGLMLILFVVAHLAGNILLFFGPDLFNAYAKKISDMRPAFYAVEYALLSIFLIHAGLTITLVKENRKARGKGYAVNNSRGPRSLSTRIMPYTGIILLAYIIWHLRDFTYTDHHGARSVVDGVELGLYGLVYNSFKDPIHALLYVLAMPALGFHLAHGVQSCVQTFGFNHPIYTPLIKRIGLGLGIFVAAGFGSIPIFIHFFA